MKLGTFAKFSAGGDGTEGSRVGACGSPRSSAGGMTSTSKVAAGAKSVAEAWHLGGAKDRTMTAVSPVVPAGAKVCWCGRCGAATAATAVVPAGAKSVGVGETSRQKSVDEEHFMQLLRNVGQERALRMFENLRERHERLEQVATCCFFRQACGRMG